MRLAVLVIIETDDPILNPETMNVRTQAAVARIRDAVIANLPKLTRVMLITPEPMARVMVAAHEAGMEAIGRSDVFIRPGEEREH